MLVIELDRRHRAALESHLAAHAARNIFPLDLLEHASKLARFFVAFDEGDRIRATVLLVGEGRLAVPEGAPEAIRRLGDELVQRFDVLRIIGAEDAAAALFDCLDLEPLRLDRVHHLMELQVPPPPVTAGPAVERAGPADLEEVLPLSAAMHLEELGTDPREDDPEGFERNVLSRLRKGRTFVIRAGGTVVWKTDVGSDCQYGAQLEGVYTRPAWRGRGLAAAGLSTLSRALLERRPRVTLHVHAENAAALRAYAKAGFRSVDRLRLLAAD